MQLTLEQKQAMDAGQPVPVVVDGRECILLTAEAYEQVRKLIEDWHPATTVVAEQRHTHPRQLSRDLSGELDWIVMKCLEKNRARRYETANGLARDIEYYLQHGGRFLGTVVGRRGR